MCCFMSEDEQVLGGVNLGAMCGVSNFYRLGVGILFYGTENI